MRKVGIILFTVCSFSANGQSTCDCKSELEFVVDYFETNLPGFKDNVGPSNQSEYDALKSELAKEAAIANNEIQCYKTINYYVEFFKDNHSRLTMSTPSVDERDRKAVKAFLESDLYLSCEKIELQNSDLEQFPHSDVRGIYELGGGAYTIAVIPDKGTFRDYVGIIVNSKTKLWSPGQVKMELKSKENEKSFEAFVYMRNHSLHYYPNFTLEDGVLGDGWIKQSRECKISHAVNENSDFSFELLSDTVAYLRIPSFSGDYSAVLDSLYKLADPIIRKTPYLIIDVRNNGGGSDSNVSPLIPYIYTNPIPGDTVEFYVTEANINVWSSWCDEIRMDTINYSREELDWFYNELARIEDAPLNTFVPRSLGEETLSDSTLLSPERVAIIQNKNCASSCETLLFYGRESNKTILVGENSGGYVGYGEVGHVNTPCYGYTLYCTMTRYRQQRSYEVVGIPPTNYLDYSREWIGQTIELLSK